MPFLVEDGSMNIRLVMYLSGKLSIALCHVAMVVPIIHAAIVREYIMSWALSFLL